MTPNGHLGITGSRGRGRADTALRAAAAAFVALVMAIAAEVPAQQEPSPAAQPSARERSRGIEEVVITAQKREETLQEAALSVSALGTAEIERFGVSNTENIGDYIPGIQVHRNGNGTATQIYSRGMGTADSQHPANGSRVALYVDGVYIGNQQGALFDLIDLERLEVLRGPQGTLYGRNTIGGAINILSAKPTSELGGKGKIVWGQDKQLEGHASVNVPLIPETLLARIAVSRVYRDVLYSNRVPGVRGMNDKDGIGFRGALRWLPTEDVTIDYVFQLDETDVTGQPVWVSTVAMDPGTGAACGFGNVVACYLQAFGLDIRQRIGDRADPLYANERTFVDTLSRLHAATVTWDVNENLTLKSISGWRKLRMGLIGDLDGTELQLFQSNAHVWQRTFMEELQAVGTALDGRLDYAVGGTWFEEEFDNVGRTLNLPFLAPGTTAVCNICGFLNLNRDETYVGDNYAWGIYSQLSLHATEKLTLTAGLRYTKERKEAVRSLRNFAPSTTVFFADQKRDARFDNWSPMMRISYDWTESLMTYLTWVRGYQAGGFNARVPTPPGGAPPSVLEAFLAPYEDENVYSWEAGLKSQWLDDRLQINLSGYYNDVKDQQQATFIPGGGTATIVQNAGRSRVRGFEVEVRARPIDNLDVVVNHAWVHASISEFEDLATGLDIARTREFAFTPKRSWSANVQYVFPTFGVGTPVVSVGFSRIGKMGFLGLKSQNALIGADHYTLYNLRVAVEDVMGREGLWVALVGTNLGDRVYRRNGIDFGSFLGWSQNSYGDPRLFRVEAGFEF
jgi:iron complex outermembrane receptor protein